MHKLLQIVSQNGVVISAKKMQSFQTNVSFLGFNRSHSQIHQIDIYFKFADKFADQIIHQMSWANIIILCNSPSRGLGILFRLTNPNISVHIEWKELRYDSKYYTEPHKTKGQQLQLRQNSGYFVICLSKTCQVQKVTNCILTRKREDSPSTMEYKYWRITLQKWTPCNILQNDHPLSPCVHKVKNGAM